MIIFLVFCWNSHLIVMEKIAKFVEYNKNVDRYQFGFLVGLTLSQRTYFLITFWLLTFFCTIILFSMCSAESPKRDWCKFWSQVFFSSNHQTIFNQFLSFTECLSVCKKQRPPTEKFGRWKVAPKIQGIDKCLNYWFLFNG
jgi:hypothetical protein